MNAAIIGTSKIAQIHLRELIKKKFNKIYIATRNFKNLTKIINKYSNSSSVKIIPVKYTQLRNLKYKFISICSPTSIHHKNIFFLKKKSNTIFIVEKPLISYLDLKKNFQKIYNKIYNLKTHIVVVYPMYYMASAFLKKFQINVDNIKNINIHYKTKGRHQKTYIAEDLLPHALSFFYRVLKKKIQSLNLISVKTKVSKNKWFCKIKFNFLNLNIFFSQNPMYKESKFYFEINRDKYVRKLFYKKNIPITSINYKNYSQIIKNPMTMTLNSILKMKSSHTLIKNNKKITDFIFLIQKKLLNNDLY